MLRNVNVPSSMFDLHTNKEQWSISAQFSSIVSIHLGAFECPGDGGFGGSYEVYTKGDLFPLIGMNLWLKIYNLWFSSCERV